MRWPCNVWLALAVLALTLGCGHSQAPSPPAASPFEMREPDLSPAKPHRGTSAAAKTPSACPRFQDVAEELGVVHVYENGERGESLMVEAVGGGGGWLDYDGDGHSDLYLVQGGDPAAAASAPQPNDQLFQNIGATSFRNVTDMARIIEPGYGQGLAAGDFDGDGFDDVYVTNLGGNTLWRNQGDGTFENVTEAAGVADGRWSSSAAWADLDLDGDLDLYVCNYCIFDPRKPLECRNPNGERRICHPRDVKPWPDELYLNRGDGTFRPQAKERGLFGNDNRALGVAVADFNNDGLPDIYVANDTTANFLFLNQGGGFFREVATTQGCAVDRNGAAQASMGLAVGDYDQNGYLDIYSTHFEGESNTLYRNLGAAGFEDVTGLVGLHAPTLPFLAFGAVMADFNLDGRQDLFVANGHIENYPGNPRQKMTAQLFAFDERRFEECSSAGGPYFERKLVGRGVASCDFDDDGDLDLAVFHQNDPVSLLRNDSQRGHWIKVRFRGPPGNRRGIGARVFVQAGDNRQMQELCGGTSFAVSHEPVLIFGLGERSGSCRVTVRWPGGKEQTLSNVSVDQTIVFDASSVD